jgi:hypothetical protein
MAEMRGTVRASPARADAVARSDRDGPLLRNPGAAPVMRAMPIWTAVYAFHTIGAPFELWLEPSPVFFTRP